MPPEVLQHARLNQSMDAKDMKGMNRMQSKSALDTKKNSKAPGKNDRQSASPKNKKSPSPPKSAKKSSKDVAP